MTVYIVQKYEDILYAGTSLKEAKKFFYHIQVWEKGKFVGGINFNNHTQKFDK